MNWKRASLPGRIIPAVLLPLLLVFPASAADSLTWRRAPDRVDAEIEGWRLPRLLEQISEATGWEVYVQPDTELKRPASAHFRNATTGEALSRLLGDLNYALAPRASGPAKLFVFRTDKGAATERVRREKPRAGKPIPDELVVTTKRGIEDLARQNGATITGRAEGLDTYRLKFADEAAARTARAALEGSADVSLVDNNYSVQRPPTPDIVATATSAAALSIKPGAGPDASRLIIGLIDTPVQALGAPYQDFVLPALSVTGEARAESNLPTHGTSMLETILRGLDQAPLANSSVPVRILPVDVYGSGNATSTFDVARGIAAAINGGASIINLSLGSDGDSQFLHNIIRQGFDRGVLFTAAAGNEPTTAATYPAAYPEVLAVSARDRRGGIASYANFGSFVDVIAPDASLVAYGGRNFVVSGTSTSTAYISGFAAGLSVGSGSKPISSAKALLPYFSVTTPRRP